MSQTQKNNNKNCDFVAFIEKCVSRRWSCLEGLTADNFAVCFVDMETRQYFCSVTTHRTDEGNEL